MPDGVLICPVCSALVYRNELEELSARARSLAGESQFTAAREAWRSALAYLPADSRQFSAIGAKIDELNRLIPKTDKKQAPIQKPESQTGKLGFFLAAGLFLWKFKVIFVFALTKAKLLLFGLTKASTFFSLFLSLGVYWSLFGWQLAAGFLLCIYLHEMGHVFELQRLGIKATAPMFLPGIGAFVRMHEAPANAVENARVGLGGPLWGLIATFGCYAIFLATDVALFAALTRLSAWINLFNLLPFWQLDGNRSLSAVPSNYRLALAGVALLTFLISHEGLLVLLAVLLAVRAFGADAPAAVEKGIFYRFCLLIVTLGILSAVEVNLKQPAAQPANHAAVN